MIWQFGSSHCSHIKYNFQVTMKDNNLLQHGPYVTWSSLSHDSHVKSKLRWILVLLNETKCHNKSKSCGDDTQDTHAHALRCMCMCLPLSVGRAGRLDADWMPGGVGLRVYHSLSSGAMGAVSTPGCVPRALGTGRCRARARAPRAAASGSASARAGRLRRVQ